MTADQVAFAAAIAGVVSAALFWYAIFKNM